MLPIPNNFSWIQQSKEEENPNRPVLEIENQWYHHNQHFQEPREFSFSGAPSSSSSNFPYVENFTDHFPPLNFMPQNSPFDPGFGELGSIYQMGSQNLTQNQQLSPTHFVPAPEFGGFDEGFLNRYKLLKPLDNRPSVGEQPTLFQKRAALRKNLDSDKIDSVTVDGSSLNYDSDELSESLKMEERSKAVISGANAKGKRKGMPSKNLMAERRRRQKLNDRLYMLRSIVPKISKMDRASILGDAVEYLKELMQKINDLQNELEPPPSSSSMPQAKIMHPLTPTLPNIPSQNKGELQLSPLPSPNGEPARIEVRLREGRTMNIHMFCGKKPGLLLSTMRALDNVGLDVQQAVINCFNGFSMDIFRAEQCKGQDLNPEHIKSLLLESAGLANSTEAPSRNC